MSRSSNGPGKDVRETVATGSRVAATLNFTTNGNTALSGNWSLNFEAQSKIVTAIAPERTQR